MDETGPSPAGAWNKPGGTGAGPGGRFAYRYYVIGAGLLLVTAVCFVMLGMAFRQDRLIKRQVHEKADALFEGIVLMRAWNADHGGVYVKKTPGMKSNPYLKSPDMKDAEGNVYTLKNPALMTRELSEYAEVRGLFGFHITSLKLKNPSNEPDAWERSALESFENGVEEVTEVVNQDGRLYYRLMKPLFVNKACLRCHEEQGYSVGEVRGGISVTLPYNDTYKSLRENFYYMVSIAAVLVVIFVFVLYTFVWRLMRRLADQKRELEELNAAKDRFLGIAAHDLRNPLVVVGGYTELLRAKMDGEDELELIGQIKASADRMVTLISNLLDVSKIQKGTLTIRKTRVDVGSFLAESGRHNELIGTMKGVDLKLVPPEEGIRAEFDKEYMHQVLDNLLGNAFKYSRKGSTVTLGAEVAGGWLRFSVKDEGVGIPEEDLPKIFDEFTRAGSRPTGGEDGTGLGLAIVRHIVELHDGEVGVESEVGRGSTFTVSIPLSGQADDVMMKGA